MPKQKTQARRPTRRRSCSRSPAVPHLDLRLELNQAFYKINEQHVISAAPRGREELSPWSSCRSFSVGRSREFTVSKRAWDYAGSKKNCSLHRRAHTCLQACIYGAVGCVRRRSAVSCPDMCLANGPSSTRTRAANDDSLTVARVEHTHARDNRGGGFRFFCPHVNYYFDIDVMVLTFQRWTLRFGQLAHQTSRQAPAQAQPSAWPVATQRHSADLAYART